MKLAFLQDVYERPGPFATVYLDTSADAEDAAKAVRLRWRSAREQLAGDGVAARVVSMPCREWFDAQDEDYRNSVIPSEVKARVSVEAGIRMSWNDLLGDAGRAVSLEHFGESADYQTLYREFGITAEAVAQAAEESIAAAR